jgi:protein-disulfide isomerase
MRITSLSVSSFLAFSLLSFGQEAPRSNSGNPVATVAGQPVSEQELLETLGPQKVTQIQTQEYEMRSAALESLIRLKLVQAEAKKRGISAEALIEQEVTSKTADPTDGEVEAFFWGQNRAGVRFDEVKEQYRGALKQLKLQKARQVYADSLRAKADVEVLLRPPSVHVTYDPARVRGSPEAPVTIVEFSDFQCPYCRAAESALKEVLAKYGEQVKLAYLDFPLREIHPKAQTAAEAARCAGEQGKFWEYHDALYADQSKLEPPELVTRAAALNLDGKSFQSCLDSGKFKSRIQADVEQGTKVGVAGTPGFFINGVFLSGAQPPAEFEKIIDNQLALLGARNSRSSVTPGSQAGSDRP